MEERNDEYFMRLALELAAQAAEEDEVPVGAIVVRGDEIVSSAYNKRELSKCATAHAELLAIEAACRALGGWRLPGTTLYVTLEPCCMCAGAIINARVERVVYGASDLRFGALGSLTDLSLLPFNHSFEVKRGVFGDECAALLSDYFRRKRKKRELQD